MATENTFIALAQHHDGLEEHGEIHAAAGCYVPKLGKDTLSLLESHAEIAINDIAAGMQGLAHLITNYPSDVGMEATVMPQIGRLLRVLGDALEHSQDASVKIANRLWAHDRIAAAGGKKC